MTQVDATPPTQELPVQSTSALPSAPLIAHRRYRALAAAVRRHEHLNSHPSVPKRPADHALYGALEEIEAALPRAGAEPR